MVRPQAFRQRQVYGDLQTAFGLVTPSEDLDQDTMLDSWEYQIVDADEGDLIEGIQTVHVGDDYDNDGDSNKTEHDAGTDPLDPADNSELVRMVGIAVTNTAVTVMWTGGTNSTQVLERADSLAQGNLWQTVQTFDPPTSPEGRYTHFTGAVSAGYYRIRVIPVAP